MPVTDQNGLLILDSDEHMRPGSTVDSLSQLPPAFAKLAEQTGFVRQLTLWVFEQAAIFLARPDVRALGLRISVNLSTRDLMDQELPGKIEALMSPLQVPPDSLCLEITESVVVQDLPRTRATLGALKAIGVKVAIDDFGSGYSSLAHLKALPVDTLKIDRGFVQRLDQDTDDHAIVKSIVGLADSFGIDIVAEGVEEPIAARTLMQLGCYRAQGFLIARPLEPDDAAAALERGVISFQL